MTDVVLDTGDVVGEFDPGASFEGQTTIIGASNQWDDGVDDTAAIIRCYRYDTGPDDGYFGIAYAPLVGNADGKGFLSFAVRWQPDAGVHAGAVRVGVSVDGDEAVSGLLAPIVGPIRDDIFVLRPSDVTGPYSWEDIMTAVGEDRVTVFARHDSLPTVVGEASGFLAGVLEVVVTALDPVIATRVVPPRRLWPRTDGLALGSGRLYPPPTTQQSGNRFGSSSPI